MNLAGMGVTVHTLDWMLALGQLSSNILRFQHEDHGWVALARAATYRQLFPGPNVTERDIHLQTPP